MPNKNYIAGRAFEYATMRDYEKRGFDCIRASGSHGEFDVIAYALGRKPVFIQCKKVESRSTGNLLVDRFVETTEPCLWYHQCMRVKVKGVVTPMEATI